MATSTTPVQLALVGPGAIGRKHIDAIARIPNCAIGTIVGIDPIATRAVADRSGVATITTDLGTVLADPTIDGVILCSPTQLHASQALQCLNAGKHVLVEIPVADALADAEAVADAAKRTGHVAMVAHTRRYNFPHRHLHDAIALGETCLQQMNVTTHFLRRDNRNAEGEPRAWADNLLWHHAAHTVDLFAWQAGPIELAQVLAGPLHPDLGIEMDMAIQLRSKSGSICSLSLSFNNAGPIGSVFRYICTDRTWVARYDELSDGYGAEVGTVGAEIITGIEAQDRDFVAAIRGDKPACADIAAVLPCYRILDDLQKQLAC